MIRTLHTICALFLSLSLAGQSFSDLEGKVVEAWEKEENALGREAFSAAFEAYFTHPSFCASSKVLPIFGSWDGLPEVGEYLMNGFNSYVIVSTSDDGRLKIYAYDDMYGGSIHGYSNYFQFWDSIGNCHSLVMDSLGEGEGNGFYRIETVKTALKCYYVCRGYGTYGRGAQHFVIRIFEIGPQSIREVFELYPNREVIMSECSRIDNPQIHVNHETGIIQYPEYELDEESGYYKDSFVMREIRLKD